MPTFVQALRPLAVPLAAFLVIEGLALDRMLAHALFHDASTRQWLGAGDGRWWARDLLHDDARWLVRGIAAGALLLWLASYVAPLFLPWRPAARFVFLAMAVPVALVGSLKWVTNVDCPWDLVEFGGTRPYVALLGHRPDYLPSGHCFPGAHSASGFALLCFHFLWRDRSPRLARWSLWMGAGAGLLFAFGQEARGAHFLSHDLASLIVVWSVQSCLYGWLLAARTAPAGPGRCRGRVSPAAAPQPSRPIVCRDTRR